MLKTFTTFFADRGDLDLLLRGVKLRRRELEGFGIGTDRAIFPKLDNLEKEINAALGRVK